jgi:transcriptional regulator with XRE-family HTH domain
VKRVEPQRVLRDLGRRVAELRQGRDLTQEQLAEQLGISTRYLQRIEAGEENLTVGSIVDLANALRAQPIEFLQPPSSRAVKTGRPPRRPTQ